MIGMADAIYQNIANNKNYLAGIRSFKLTDGNGQSVDDISVKCVLLDDIMAILLQCT